ncbi:MAG: PAS domain S-box protein [Methanomicrobiaceae archaeon]|uniref:histidine kinase n=1 Tax=hydrocarbon metagenome TaxID=938273 RepID=A0A0W8FK51_9ZZZZ|nr:PAS domain S-box protein [Methanomicrobiaceae archaeon]MDD5419930.1 PAS domain S-box protein [Methanomicrobiaceae archaeon]
MSLIGGRRITIRTLGIVGSIIAVCCLRILPVSAQETQSRLSDAVTTGEQATVSVMLLPGMAQHQGAGAFLSQMLGPETDLTLSSAGLPGMPAPGGIILIAAALVLTLTGIIFAASNARQQYREERPVRLGDICSAILERAGSAAVIIEGDGTIVSASPEFSGIFLPPGAGPAGKSLWAHLPAGDGTERMRQYYERRRANPDAEPGWCGVELIDRWGTKHTLLLTVARIPGTGFWMLSLEDASGQTRTAQPLRAALRHSPAGVFFQDADLRYTWIHNPFPGLAAGDLLGRTDREIFSPEDAARLTALKRRVLETGGVVRGCVRIGAGKSARFYDLALEPRYGCDREITGISGVVFDITGQKRREEHLKTACDLLEEIVDGLADIVAIQLPDHTILRYNRAGYEMLGMPPEEVNGRKCYELIGRTSPCDICATGMAVESGERRVVEKYVPELGRFLECRSSPILDEHGDVALIIEQLYDITASRRTAEALARANAYNRSLIEAGLDPLVIIDREGMITDVNAAAELVTGRRRDELIGTEFSGCFTDAARAEAAYREVFREGRIRDYELEILQRDGRTTPVLLNASVFRNEDGAIAGVFAAARDITERKQAEAALREGEARYRRLVENLNEGIWVIDPGGIITFVNSRMAEMLGYDASEVAGRSHLAWMEEDCIEAALRGMERRKQGISESRESALTRKDGTRIDVLISSAPIIDEGGRYRGAVSAVLDITGRKRAEEARRESEERYRSFVENFHGIAFRRTLDARTIFSHGAVKEITGYAEEEFLAGRPKWHDIVYAPDREILARDDAMLRSVPGHAVDREYRIVRKDGAVRWIRERIQTLCDSSNCPSFVQGALFDVTEEKRAEEALRMSEERFRSIFEESVIGIEFYDAKGRLLYINPASLEIFGVSDPRDMEGFCFFDEPNFQGQDLRQLQQGRVARFAVPYDFDEVKRQHLFPTSKSGILHLDVMIRPIPSREGALPEGYLVQIQDVTGQVRTEEAKQQAYDRIEQNIEQFAILGDHIRQPLQVIMGLSELIEDARAEKIIEQVQRINGIVTQLDQGWIESRKIREFLRRNE